MSKVKAPISILTCFNSACHPIVVIRGNASGQCQKNIYDVFTNMKTEKNTHKDTLVRSSDPSTLHVARLHHPPKRVTGSNSRSSRPQRGEPGKKPSGKETRETLEEMGLSDSVLMGQVGQNVKMNVKM